MSNKTKTSKNSNWVRLSTEDKAEMYAAYSKAPSGTKAELREQLAKEYNTSTSTISNWMKKISLTLNQPEEGEHLYVKGKSTLYDCDGKVKIQWIKEDTATAARVSAIHDSITDLIVNGIDSTPRSIKEEVLENLDSRSCNLYISNDVHIGALMWKEETNDRDWDTALAEQEFMSAIDYLMANSPDSKTAVVADLGDLTEIDDFKNMTPHSGNVLQTDARYSKVMTVAMRCMVYAIDRALEKHETVHFLNISGNHDITTGHAIRAFVGAWYRNDPRVLVDDRPMDIKYFQFGSTLLGFAHGDGMKMNVAGEVMAADNEKIFSETSNRYFHFGHFHKDAVHDGRLCRSESHRNMSPLNHWAAHKGFRGQAGTMKCITYELEKGEISRNTYKVTV